LVLWIFVCEIGEIFFFLATILANDSTKSGFSADHFLPTSTGVSGNFSKNTVLSQSTPPTTSFNKNRSGNNFYCPHLSARYHSFTSQVTYQSRVKEGDAFTLERWERKRSTRYSALCIKSCICNRAIPVVPLTSCGLNTNNR
jgi:hypothetical protein